MPAFVQSKKAQGTNAAAINDFNVTFDADVAKGNLIVVGVFWGGTPDRTVTVTDSLGNSYAPALWAPTGRGFYARNIIGGACTATATVSGAPVNGYHTMVVHEVSGCDLKYPFVTEDLNSQFAVGTGANAVTTRERPVNQDNCYVFAMGERDDDVVGTLSAGTGFNSRESNNDGVNLVIRSEDLIKANAGGQRATLTASVTMDTSSMMMVFCPPRMVRSRSSRLVLEQGNDGHWNDLDVRNWFRSMLPA